MGGAEDAASSDATNAGAANRLTAPDNRPRLLVVDDDENQRQALQRAFEKRGYAVKAASSASQAEHFLADWRAGYAVIDLRLPGPSGITLIPRLKQVDPEVRAVVLTGYASIATAIEAIKLGAVYYLTKPVDADTIETAFRRVYADERIQPNCSPLSVARLEWEHIHGVLSDHHGNVSATARALGMHRRTLQRKLGKFPARR